MADADIKDREASGRLRAEVIRLYERRARFTKTAFSEDVGIRRPTIDAYLEDGTLPSLRAMKEMARVVEVEPSHLWAKWFGFDLGDDNLRRIADALERAYPPITFVPADPEATEVQEVLVERRFAERRRDESGSSPDPSRSERPSASRRSAG